MIVNLDSEDRTWITHFEGAVAIFRGRDESEPRSVLDQALQALDREQKCGASPAISTQTDRSHTALLLEVIRLKLWHLAREWESLQHSKLKPRKLDVRAIQLHLKRLRQDLQTIFLAHKSLEPNEELDLLTLDVTFLNMLTECGTLLYEQEQYQDNRKSSELTVSARNVIERLGRALVEPTGTYSSKSCNGPVDLMALAKLWPLAVIRLSPAASESSQLWARETLLEIGSGARIPKALHLAALSRPEARHSDALAGLMLISFAQESWGNDMKA